MTKAIFVRMRSATFSAKYVHSLSTLYLDFEEDFKLSKQTPHALSLMCAGAVSIVRKRNCLNRFICSFLIIPSQRNSTFGNKLNLFYAKLIEILNSSAGGQRLQNGRSRRHHVTCHLLWRTHEYSVRWGQVKLLFSVTQPLKYLNLVNEAPDSFNTEFVLVVMFLKLWCACSSRGPVMWQHNDDWSKF